jgi:acetyltransferase
MQISSFRRLADGSAAALRPVRSHDAAALQALIEGLSPRDRRWRFHGAVRGVTPERLDGMTRLDAARGLAVVVAAEPGGPLLADARCVLDGTGGAEFALMVAAGRRRLGIGAWALAGLRAAAAARGLRWLHGTILADNTPMLALLRGAGFLCVPRHGDARLVGVELCLQAAGAAAPRPH